MTDKLPDIWATRDFPVLVEVARRVDLGQTSVYLREVQEATSLSQEEVQRAGASLLRRKLVRVIGTAEIPVLRFADVSAEAYFLTGLHPSGDDAVSDLVALLQQAADRVDDPEERSRLRRLADAAGGVSREVLGGVLTALVTGGITN